MKTLVAVLVLIAVAVLVLTAALPAHAEHGLYLNLDNKSWQLTATFLDPDECDKAARRAMRNHEALGAGCSFFVRDDRVVVAPRPATTTTTTAAPTETKKADPYAEYNQRLQDNAAANELNSYRNRLMRIGR